MTRAPPPLFSAGAQLADHSLAGHVLHRGSGPAAEHRIVRGRTAGGEVLASPCSSTGRALPGAALEVLDPRAWPALARLLVVRGTAHRG